MFRLVHLLTRFSLASQFGRKPAMYTLWLLLAVSVTCESVAKQWQVWVCQITYHWTCMARLTGKQFVGKLFAGIGVGSLQFITPTYVSEIAPVRVRGMLLIMYNFWLVHTRTSIRIID